MLFRSVFFHRCPLCPCRAYPPDTTEAPAEVVCKTARACERRGVRHELLSILSIFLEKNAPEAYASSAFFRIFSASGLCSCPLSWCSRNLRRCPHHRACSAQFRTEMSMILSSLVVTRNDSASTAGLWLKSYPITICLIWAILIFILFSLSGSFVERICQPLWD